MFRIRIILAGYSALLACESPIAPSDLEVRPDVRALVTGSVAQALTPAGHFVLPRLEAPDATPIVSVERAGELARALIRALQTAITPPGFGSILERAEQVHGSAIDWDHVVLEDPVGYATHSPYQPLPDSIPLWVRRRVGPHYIIGLRVGEQQVASVAVAAAVADHSIDGQGILRAPLESGNGFFTIGVAARTPTHAPLHPEEAVREVATRTGARVAEVPVLIQPPIGVTAHGSGWKLVLEREVELEGTDGVRYRSRQVHVLDDPLNGGPPRWRIPAATQPSFMMLEYHVRTPGGLERRETLLQIRAGFPVAFIDIRLPDL